MPPNIPPWFRPIVGLCRVRNRFASRRQCRSTGLEHHTAGPGRYDGSPTASGGPPPKSTGHLALTLPPDRLAGGQNYSVGRRMNRRTDQHIVTDALQVLVLVGCFRYGFRYLF